ncbi:hypothetical protein D3C81_1619660 [compost metagenome]
MGRHVPVARHVIDLRLRGQVEAVHHAPVVRAGAVIGPEFEVVGVERAAGRLRRRRGHQPERLGRVDRQRQRQRAVGRGAAEADIGEIALVRHLHAQQHVRQPGGRMVRRQLPAHARGQGYHGIAERLEGGAEQGIELEAVAAAPFGDEFFEHV